MFRKLSLENFKGFASEQTIELKPITLIYGANSSGKSSILQSLLLLKQTLEQSNDKSAILLSKGKYVDLGNYNEFVNDHDKNKTLKIKLDLPPINDRFLFRDIKNRKSKINIGLELLFSQTKNLEIDKLKIYIENEEFITLSKTTEEIPTHYYRYFPRFYRFNSLGQNKSKLNYEIFSINYKSVFWGDIINHIKKYCFEDSEDIISRYKTDNKSNRYENYLTLKEYFENNDIEKINEELTIFYKRYIFNFTNFLPNICLLKDDDNKECKIESLYKLSRAYSKIPNLDAIFDMASFITMDILEKLQYIGPLRENPERYYISSGNTYNYVGKTGSEYPDILYENKEQILKKTNKWLKSFTNYSIKVTSAARKSKEKGTQNVYSLRLIDSVTNTNVNITDVGFGISQILPIIVQSFKSNGDLILIEQPEIHIHPKLQAEMGSMFAEACENNNFIIETHSENILLRLKKMVRTGKLDKDKLSIIYVDKTEEGSICCPIRLDDNGDFVDKWPKGFFEESLEELF